jgi:DNA-binding GntR family transcriptional regulator
MNNPVGVAVNDLPKKPEKYSRFVEIYENLKKKIISCELPSGHPLGEEALAEQFQVSRTPIREAFRKLEMDGFVEIIPRRGAFVKGIQIKDIEEIYDIREALEGISARKTAELISDENLQMIETSLQRSETVFQQGNWQQSFEYGNDLHQIIFQIQGNIRILEIVAQIKNQINRLHSISTLLPGRLELSIQEHRGIFTALAHRDGDLAEKKMREHIVSTKNSMILSAKNDLYKLSR